MIQFPVYADIIKLIQQQVQSLHPLAEANQVKLRFQFDQPSEIIKFYPEFIITDFVHLLSKIIIFSPQEHQVDIELIKNIKTDKLHISIFAHGALLPVPKSALLMLDNDLSIEKDSKGTKYTLSIPIEEDSSNESTQLLPKEKDFGLPDFYLKFRNQLKTHITTFQNLEKRAEEKSEKDGILLKKINAIIIAHLDDESFDTSILSRALALSRTQLYRKLNPLIRQSPGKYIRFVRLQKAKELLSESDLPIGDIGTNVGFPDQSHFTRAFKNQYGYNPSQIRNNQYPLKKISSSQQNNEV